MSRLTTDGDPLQAKSLMQRKKIGAGFSVFGIEPKFNTEYREPGTSVATGRFPSAS
jgi:hypothetical protein